jgi:hypothetical protein
MSTAVPPVDTCLRDVDRDSFVPSHATGQMATAGCTCFACDCIYNVLTNIVCLNIFSLTQ